jgi:UDP-3-O-[3-hydroxymyristoyl] N-acetylglucosamine deacetylase
LDYFMQQTLAHSVSLTGVGLHSGAETLLTLRPAETNAGLVFVRTDVSDRPNRIEAKWDRVLDTRLCTLIGNESGVTVATIEHVMAALRACGIDNAVLELDGPEVPILDGSSAPFMKAILAAGVKTQTQPRKVIKILKDVRIEDGDKWVVLKPHTGMVFNVTIDFPHPSIGRQTASIDMLQGQFYPEFSKARTFGFAHEVAALRAQGLALGGSLDNAIVLDHDKILNKEGLRYGDEFARHKLLDAVGDLFLAGMPILGAYESYKAGHGLNNQILRALFAQKECYSITELYMSHSPRFDLASEDMNSDSHMVQPSSTVAQYQGVLS